MLQRQLLETLAILINKEQPRTEKCQSRMFSLGAAKCNSLAVKRDPYLICHKHRALVFWFHTAGILDKCPSQSKVHKKEVKVYALNHNGFGCRCEGLHIVQPQCFLMFFRRYIKACALLKKFIKQFN